MPTLFAELMESTGWPLMLNVLGESAVYTPANGTPVSFVCVPAGRNEDANLDVSWEVAAGQIEIHAAASDVPAAYTPRKDTIAVRGETYTVLERQTQAGAVYRYLCERQELERIQHHGRRF